MKKIILASASPRRKQILRKLGLKFRVMPSRIKENIGHRFSLIKLKRLALEKALSAAKKFKSGIVIGADTVVVLKGKVYGKPKDLNGAKKMLGILSGTAQYVWTAVSVVDAATKKTAITTVRSKVVMKKLKPKEIDMLAAKNLDKAGAYAAQDDDRYIERIEGSFTNVVGFPVEALKQLLKKFGISTKARKCHEITK